MRSINFPYQLIGKVSNRLCPKCNKGYLLFYKNPRAKTEIYTYSCYCGEAYHKINGTLFKGVPNDFYSNELIQFEEETIFEEFLQDKKYKCEICNSRIKHYRNDDNEIFIDRCTNPNCNWYIAERYLSNEELDIDFDKVVFLDRYS